MIAAIPPRERTVVEGNLVEHPIWKLANRQARPKRPMRDESNRKHDAADPGAGRLVVDELTRRFARAGGEAHR